MAPNCPCYMIKPKKKTTITIASFLFIIVQSAALLAETPLLASAAGTVDVAIATRSLGATPNPSLAGILELAAKVQIQRKGFRSVVLKRVEGSSSFDPATALGRPETQGASYLLLAEYSEKAGKLELRLAWFDGEAKTWVAEVARSGPEDMLMDELIFRALTDLLDRVAETSSVPKKADEVAPGTEPASPIQESSDSGKAPSPRTPRGFELSFGVGPFLAGGSLGDFFSLAAGLDCQVLWYFRGQTSSFGLGLSMAGQAFKAEGPLESATGILAPLALELSLVPLGTELRPTFHLSGGAALLYLRTEIYGDRYSVLPFASAGLGLAKVFDSGLGLSLDLAYQVALDGTDLIMGFNPTMKIEFPLGRQP